MSERSVAATKRVAPSCRPCARHAFHMVVTAKQCPERVMNDLKTYASRRWAGHGSTLYLWKAKDVDTAVRCVVYEQGADVGI